MRSIDDTKIIIIIKKKKYTYTYKNERKKVKGIKIQQKAPRT